MKSNRKHPLVLIIDDEAISRLLLTQVLEIFEFGVAEAEDGASGLEQFQRLRPDMVLLDVIMPGLDGFEVCTRLRQMSAGRHVPVLMLTGLDDIDSINRAYRVGATDFISKPINYSLLGHRLLYMLRAARAMDELRASERRLIHAQRIARLGHWQLEPERMNFYLSPEVAQILGRPELAQEGAVFRTLLDYIHPEDRERVSAVFQQHLPHTDGFSIEHRVVLPGGEMRIVHQEAEPTDDGDWLGTLQDITERKRSEEKIIRLAYYDSLTRLPNRAFLVEYLDYLSRTPAGQTATPFSLLFINLDHFKRINTTWGLSLGNKLLGAVALRLRNCLPGTAAPPPEVADMQEGEPVLLTHLGGDEFVLVLLRTATVEAATALAQRVLGAFSQPFVQETHRLFLSASIGIARFPDDADEVESLLTRAELAMHHAKERGRNTVRGYEASMNTRLRDRVLLEHELHKAIENQEFEVYYQPKVDIQSQRVVGAEALVRWRHPQRGLVEPARFVPLTEESDMIEVLGEWVLRTACAQTRAWQRQGLKLQIAVNLSARQFRAAQLAPSIGNVLRQTGLKPQYLELEITETLLLEDSRLSHDILDQLKAMKLSIALDDFGTGYSSLSYLKRLRPHTLKIDRCFIQDLHTNQDSASITAAIIALSRILKLNVVAEGVEQAAQLEFLRSHRCQQAQGYFFSPPLPATEFLAWVRNFHRLHLPAASVDR